MADKIDVAHQEQTRAAARRYRQDSAQREEDERKRESTGRVLAGAAEQLEARATRLMQQGEVPIEAVVEMAGSRPADRPDLLERIIGASKDFQAVSFLTRGARAAATVARISTVDGGRELPLGTGFLVGPRLLMTNNHVFPDSTTAAAVVVDFGAQAGIDNLPTVPLRYRLDPDTLFLTDRQLDFSVVAVQRDAAGQLPGERFGWNPLVVQQGKIVIGEPVNIVGHPMGRLMEISIRNNLLVGELEQFLHYETDTEPGNSGSPVFNDQWEVVALHHSGVPATDAQGRFLRKDRKVWQAGDGDDAIDWVANEGARVSVILRRLAGLVVTAAQRAVLAEMGPQSGLATADGAPLTGTVASSTVSPLAGPAASVAGPVPAAAVAGPVSAAPVASPVSAAAPPATAAGAGSVGDAAEAVGPHGLAGRAGVAGGTTQLVFLHGRGQQGRDPTELRRAWTAGLNRGLTEAGLDALDPDDAYFPFYGDRLADGLRAQEAAPVPAETLLTDPATAAAPARPSTRQLYAELIDEAARQAGMPIVAVPPPEEGLRDLAGGLVRRLQPQLSWLAARSGLDDLTIAWVFRDVAAYLDDKQLRKSVLEVVKETLPSTGRMVLVSHSLGTVVAMDLLTELSPGLRVGLLVTAGSPLGLDSVYDRLQIGGPHRPDVDRWTNVWAAADAVAIGCPLADDWTGQLDELLVDNPKDRAHSIEEYLSHREVAAAVLAGLHP